MMGAMDPEYNDDWATCAATFATLRVMSAELTPAQLTGALRTDPSESYAFGEPVHNTGRTRKTNGWFLTSEGRVESLDLSRHIDWVLDQIAEPDALPGLLARGVKADIFCYWESRSGHGGPEFTSRQMGRLAALGLPVGIDVYFPEITHPD
jgi:hypothetical protein